MLVYTAAKTYGLPAATAQDVAQFIRVSSTEGQQPGRGNGQLAAGYVPIASSGVTQAALPAGAAGRGRGRGPEGAADVTRRRATRRRRRRARPPARRTGRTSGRAPRCCAAGIDTRRPSPAAATPDDGTTTVADGALVKTAAVSRRSGAGLLILLLVGCVVAGVGAIVGRTVLASRGLR